MPNALINRRIAAVSASQYALVTRRQALDAGMSYKAIEHRRRTGLWDEPERGVYRVAGSEPSWRQALMARALAVGPRGAAARQSAAALWRLPGFRPGPLEVVNPYGKGHTSPAGLRQSCDVPERHITVIDGIRVTTVARTLFDLACLLHQKWLERTIDNAIGLDLIDAEALRLLVEELGARGRPGTAIMRELVADRGVGYVATESELEDLFVAFTARFGLAIPSRQVPLGDDAPVGRVDFFYPKARLVVELDGRRNHTALLDREADYARDSRFTAMGLRVMRITWRRLTREPQAVAAELQAALRIAA